MLEPRDDRLRIAVTGARGFVGRELCAIVQKQCDVLPVGYLRRKSRVFRFPMAPLRMLASAAGRAAEYQRLTGDLWIDSSLVRSVLDWKPSKSLEAGMAEMVNWFVRSAR